MLVELYVFVFFELYGDHRDLHVLTHSFPTRRSSDLYALGRKLKIEKVDTQGWLLRRHNGGYAGQGRGHQPARRRGRGGGLLRSEEHTSELQSLMRISYAVFCLKKKNSLNTN